MSSTPTTALVHVDASGALREWTRENGMVVLRLATGDGAPAVGDRERAASFAVYRGVGPDQTVDAYAIIDVWRESPVGELTDLGYPDARHGRHVVAPVAPLSERDRDGLARIADEVADRAAVYRERTPFGLPFVVWLDGEVDRHLRRRETGEAGA
jgi:hypothetical protein